MRDRPTAKDLLETAEAALDGLGALAPERRRYVELMAANARAIAERQAAAGEGPDEALRATLARRLGIDGDIAALEKALAEGIRAGLYDEDTALFGLLWRATVARVKESNPKFLERTGIDPDAG